MATALGWVYEESLLRALENTSNFVGYDFGESDWVAVTHGLSTTDHDADRWFQYPIVGKPELELRVARAHGDGIVIVSVAGEMGDVLEARVSTTLDLL